MIEKAHPGARMRRGGELPKGLDNLWHVHAEQPPQYHGCFGEQHGDAEDCNIPHSLSFPSAGTLAVSS